MQAYLESIVCKFGGNPTICLREVQIQYIVYIVDKLIAILRSRERAK